MTPRPWTRVAREPLRDCRVFQVGRIVARAPESGALHDFYTIDSTDWVNVIALTADDEIVMVRQYRHGSQSSTLEIPGGMIDAGESPDHAAARELREETGYQATRVIPLGSVNPNPALFGNRLHMFVAPGVVRVGEIQNEGAEETSVELVPLARLPKLVREGGIDHALVLAGLHHWELWRREEEERG